MRFLLRERNAAFQPGRNFVRGRHGLECQERAEILAAFCGRLGGLLL